MEVVTGATSSVLSKLGTLLQEEYYLQKGVKKDVESLQNELIFMRAALCKVAEVPPEKLDTQVKAWAGNIKELSYDMKDAVDTYEVRVAGSRLDDDRYCTWIVKMVDTVNKVKARHMLAGVIAEMKGLTVQVAELRDRYNLNDIAASTSLTTTGAAQDINVTINYQLWSWLRPLRGDIISSLIPRLMKVGGEEIEDDKNEVDTALAPLIGTKDPVGLDHDMVNLGKWMTDTSEDGNNRLRCILGVGGVGKTTVATALYRKYGHQFDLRVRVTASQLSSAGGRAVIRSIHDQVMPQQQQQQQQQGQGENGPDIDDAVQTCCSSTATLGGMMPPAPSCLRRREGSGSVRLEENCSATEPAEEVLRKKSCLLLIDDVRSEKTWREINHLLLPLNLPKQSRIIITTRSPAVASACDENGSKSSTHKMAGILSRENSRAIFLEALCESINGRKDVDHRKNIPPCRLWEMCTNHPVAIIAMAGHVAYNLDKSVEEWKQVCSNLVPDSVEAITRDGVPRILWHCYHDMPAEIKTCFLYLSMYPKGRNISRKHLIRRWLAEGFVGDKPGKSTEEVADYYFDQLIRRKMVHAEEQSSNGKVKNCNVYGVVHDFIVSMAREENLVTVIGSGSPYLLPLSGGKVRRMSLSPPAVESATQSLNMSHVRSLAVFEGLNGGGGGENGNASSPQPLISPNSPILLQVIDLEGCKGQLDMSVLCSMLLLKYISLRRTDTKSLPREIGKLSRLETLDVRETNITQLPDTMWHLECLVRILGGDKTTRKSFKLPANNTKKKAAMRSLRVLSGIEITEESLKHCEHLTKLRKLAIYKTSMKSIKSLETWIARLGDDYLHTLTVISADKQPLITVKNSSFNQLTALDLMSGGSMPAELPEWIKQLGGLTKLTIPLTLLRSDTLDSLRFMSSLFSLTFSLTAAEDTPLVAGTEEVFAIIERNKAYSGGEIIVPPGGFTRLQILRLSAPFVPTLSFLDMAMPNLERLEIRSRSLEGLFGIENLKKLKEVHMSVHVGADQFTRSLVDNIADAARKHYAGTRIIREQHQD